MSQEISMYDHAEQLNVVVQDYLLKGVTNATRIAKQTGLDRAQVLTYIDEWNAIAANDEWVKERSRQSLREFDEAYNKIIEEFWAAHEEATSTRDKNSILKNISDTVAKRQEVLQRAGLYDDAEMGDRIAVLEDQTEKIKDLMREVVRQFPETKLFIMGELGKIFKVPERTDA
jgi:hypothetical protein